MSRYRTRCRESDFLTRYGSAGGVRVVLLVLLVALMPAPTLAQQWHEFYADGVAALQSGQARQAVDRLERAIEERPEPGRLVPTYGTNFVQEYFPYLRLAEAFLALDAVEAAAEALDVSSRFAIESVEDREAIAARVRAVIDARRPPAEPEPQPDPVAADPPAAALVSSAPATGVEVAPPSAEPVAPEPAPVPVDAAPIDSAPADAPRPPPTLAPVDPAPVRPPPTADAPAALEITSDPPGARVFLDNESVGRTDPETGRLRLTGLAVGLHRLRLSADGHADVIREVDIGSQSVVIAAALPQRVATAVQGPPPVAPVPLSSEGAFGGVAISVIVGLVVLGIALVVMARRPVKAPRPKRTSSEPVGTGTDELFPVSFGPYTLVRRIGKGGMAVVYQAERGGEVLALKRPLAGFLDDDRFRERFRREAELGRTLHHPNIIRIFEQGQVDDTPYFVMELVEGETLAACLDREGRLDVTPAARVAAQVAEALDYAHSKGVIHRDLKPSNIMIAPSGTVKVMDYGVARAQHLQEVTTTRAFVGTPSYAAPETAQGASQPASDMYALGVILFEMLTGNLPFTGESAFDVVNHHRTTPPPAPSSINHALSADIDALVLRLLHKEPSGRPTAEALRNELSEHLGEGR